MNSENKKKITVSLSTEESERFELYRLRVSQQSGRIISKQELIRTALEPYLLFAITLISSEAQEDG